MRKWLRRIRGAVGMGLTWALVWAPVAVLIGLAVDPDGSMDEMWVAIGAIPGFLGGIVFSAVLAIAERRRRLDQLSLPRFAAWGAVAGLLVGSLPFVIGDPTDEVPLWLLAGTVIGTITLLSAASAAGSLALARRPGKQDGLDDGPRDEVLLTANAAADDMPLAVRDRASAPATAPSGNRSSRRP